MALSGLEYHREVRLNNRTFREENLAGEIKVESDQDKASTCTFTVFNDNDEIPVVVNPVADSKSLLQQRVELIAGYKRGLNQLQRIFVGRITNVGISFNEDGRPVVSVEAYSLGFDLNNVQRDEVYPVVDRQKTPVSDSKGAQARPETEGDSRPWAVISTGEVLTLEEIIRNIANDNDIEVGQILVPDVTYDGIDKELVQKDKTDWNFLQELADKFGCHMYIDNDTEAFYFVLKESIENEQVVDEQGTPVGDRLEFYYHRNNPSDPKTMAPTEKLDPTRADAALPMFSVNFNFDIQNIQGGFVQESTDLQGNKVLTSKVVNDDGKISQEKLVIREEMLKSEEAQDFINNYSVGETTWEDTKKFWKSKGVEVQDFSDSRENPPKYNEANLEFETFASVFLAPMRKYTVHNMGFGRQMEGEDKFDMLCLGVDYTLSEEFTMTVKMLAF